jgi:hypothetical protein
MDTRTYLKTLLYEVEADKFAVELLISNKIVLESQQYTTEQLSELIGYNEKLIELRLAVSPAPIVPDTHRTLTIIYLPRQPTGGSLSVPSLAERMMLMSTYVSDCE